MFGILLAFWSIISLSAGKPYSPLASVRLVNIDTGSLVTNYYRQWLTNNAKMTERLLYHLLEDLKNTDHLSPQYKAKVARELMLLKLKKAMTKQFAVLRM